MHCATHPRPHPPLRLPVDMEEYNYLERVIVSWSISSIRKEFDVLRMHEREHLNPHEYVRDFQIPLIEEARSKILSALKSISQLPYYCLLSVLPMEKGHHICIDVGISYRHHIVQDGDLFLVSRQEPKQLHVLTDDAGMFAIAVNVGHYNRYVNAFQANILNSADIINSEPKFAIFLCNLNEIVYPWKAMHLDIDDRTIIRQISSPSLLATRCDTCAVQQRAFDHLLNHGLDEEQQDLAAKIISNASCVKCESIDLLWGLPGTGKTKMISTVLSVLCDLQLKTLVCAPNDLHLSSLCCYLSELIKGSKLCCQQEHSIGDVLLICDSFQTKDDITKQFCLGWKLNEIMPCMLWKSRMDRLAAFKKKDFRDSFKDVTEDTKIPFIKLLKESFTSKANLLIKFLMTLRKNLPIHAFAQAGAEVVTSLADAFDEFSSLLEMEGITDQDVRIVFEIRSAQAKPSRSEFSTVKFSKKYAYATHSQSKTFFAEKLKNARDECQNHMKRLGNIPQLPYQKNIEWMRQYLIGQSSILLCLSSEAFLLHDVGIKTVNTLIVLGAAQIKESELFPALSLPSIHHVWLIGDHKQISPLVNSQVNERSGLAMSLFERLLSMGFLHHTLTRQYRVLPPIFCLLNKHFYGNQLSSAKDIDSNATKLRFNNYMFLNVDSKRIIYLIFFLVRTIIQDWKGEFQKLKVGVICSNGKQAVIKHDLGMINISITSMENIDVKDYDVLIVAAHRLQNRKGDVNYIITRARQYLWIVGDVAELATIPIWESLIWKAENKGSLVDPTSDPRFISDTEEQEVHFTNWDSFCTALGITIPHVKSPLHEFSWVSRPYNTKCLLPTVRDQKGDDNCTLFACLATMEFLYKHKAASLVPPQDFTVILSEDKLLENYVKKHNKIGKETDGRGRRRLEKVLKILEQDGAVSEKITKVEYKIRSSHLIYDKGSCEISLEEITQKLRKGKALIATFPLSMNYIVNKPVQVYEYIPDEAILTKRGGQASHAVMVVGCTSGGTETLLQDGHFVIQNSHGDYFGELGFGRVAATTISSLYEVYL